MCVRDLKEEKMICAQEITFGANQTTPHEFIIQNQRKDKFGCKM